MRYMYSMYIMLLPQLCNMSTWVSFYMHVRAHEQKLSNSFARFPTWEQRNWMWGAGCGVSFHAIRRLGRAATI